MAEATPAAKATAPSDSLNVTRADGKADGRALADVALNPAAHAMATARLFNAGSFGNKIEATDTFESIRDGIAKVAAGDLGHHRELLASQAVALNSIFTEMARRAALNMSDYIEATDRYMRLALKAQAQSRATIEALDRMARGGEQVVRHIHVDNRGGQAVIAETFNTGGQRNGKLDRQPQAIEGSAPAPG